MAKRTDKPELEIASSDALDALSTQHREILEALYEQIIVGSALDLRDLAKGQGLSYAAAHERLKKALADVGRQLQKHPALRDWLREHELKNEGEELPQTELAGRSGSQCSQLGLYYRLSEAGEDILRNSTGPLVLQGTGPAVPLSDCLASVASVEGRARVEEYLNSLPFPHYESAGHDGLLIRIEEDGSRTVGRFVDRQFQAVQC